MKSAEVHGTAVEMVLLAGLLGAEQVLGVEDPFHGWLAEEVDSAWQETRAGLLARGYLTSGPGGTTTLDETVAALVGTWAYARASFVVSATRELGPAQVAYYHVGDHLAVEQVRTDDGCRLVALGDAEAVLARVCRLSGLAAQAAAAQGSIALPESDLRRAREAAQAGGAPAALPLLLRPGASDKDAQALAATLAEPLANSALAGLARRGDAWEVAGLALLEGRNGLWRLRPFARDGADWVEAIPCAAAAAAQELRQLFNRLLPAELALG